MSKRAAVQSPSHACAVLIRKVHKRVLEKCGRLSGLALDIAVLGKSKSVQAVPRMHWFMMEEAWLDLFRPNESHRDSEEQRAFSLFTQARLTGPYRALCHYWPCADAAVEHRFENPPAAIVFSVAAELRKLMDQKAEEEGLTLNDYVVQVLLKEFARPDLAARPDVAAIPHYITDSWPCAHAAVLSRCDHFSETIYNTIGDDLPKGQELRDIASRDREMVYAEIQSGKWEQMVARVPCTAIGKALWKHFPQLSRLQFPSVLDLHAECVWEYLQACRELGIAGEYSARSDSHSLKKDPNDRDNCIYHWMQEGVKLTSIRARVNERHEWEPLDHVQSVYAAGKRFATKHQLPLRHRRMKRLISAE
jgi:hypothetical protein